VGQTVIVQQGGFQSKGCIDSLDSRLDPATAAHTSRPRQLEMNDIGTMTLVTADAFVQDAFSQSRTTGSVVCIDPYSFETLGVLLFDQPSERPNRWTPL
jgi:sulfate adenylyltransferase subunit 1 (EFTu-like GTPase family)